MGTLLIMDDKTLLQMNNIHKSYGNIQALRAVDFHMNESEIVGLVGDNGAGKSTLINILAGVIQPTQGEIFFEGEKVQMTSPDKAKQLGIETVYQGEGLCNNLDIKSNFFLGRELVNSYFFNIFEVLQEQTMGREAAKALRELEIDIHSVDKEVRFLSGGQRQAVTLARANYWGVKLLLLDEPTVGLGAEETKKALRLIQRLRDEENVSIVFISHNLQHVFPVVDRIVALQRGEVVGNRIAAETTSDEILQLITGKEVIHAVE